MDNVTTELSPHYVTTKVAVDVYVILPLCVFGITGNIMSVLVLGKDHTMKRTTGFLLQMLALADALYLTTCLFFQTLKTITVFTDWVATLQDYWPWMEPYVMPCASIAQTAGVWLVLAVTADRYIAICRPLHAPQYSTISRVRKIVLVIWIVAILYNIPRFFEREVKVVLNNQTNVTELQVKKTPLREDPTYFLVYKTCLFFVVRVFIPLSGLAFFNTRLIQAIKTSSKMQKKSRDSQWKEKHTLTLVVVVIVFAICETPDFLLRLWLALGEYIPGLPHDMNVLLHINIVTNLLLTINSCINFIIYALIGKKFRRILWHIVCKKPMNEHYIMNRSFRTTVAHAINDEMFTLVRTS